MIRAYNWPIIDRPKTNVNVSFQRIKATNGGSKAEAFVFMKYLCILFMNTIATPKQCGQTLLEITKQASPMEKHWVLYQPTTKYDVYTT